MPFLLLAAVLSDSIGLIASKFALSKERLQPAQFNAILFFFLTLFSAVGLLFGLPGRAVFEARYLWFFGLMIALAIGFNGLYARALKAETIEEFETIILLVPLMTLVFSVIFLPAEREAKMIFAGLVAAIALLLARFKRRHLELSRADRWLFGAVVMMGFENIVARFLLEVWPPGALYVVRTFFVFFFFFLFFRPSLKISLNAWSGLVVAGLSGAFLKIVQYAGFVSLGVIYTTTFLILSPFLALVFDRIVLKERIHIRNLVAIVVIIGAIIYAAT